MKKHRKGRHAYRTSTNSQILKSKRTAKPWGWLMTGLLIGTLGITVIFLFATGQYSLETLKLKFKDTSLSRESNAILPSRTKKNAAKLKIAETRQLKVNAQKKEKESTRFEFYQLLAGMEVPLPDAAAKTASATVKPTLAKTETKLAAPQYLVQAGRFRELVNAECLMQRLQSQGLSAKIQKIEAEDGLWFRVTLGPFSSETMALTQKSRLAKEKIPGILILQRQ